MAPTLILQGATAVAVRKALARREREWAQDLADARRAWGETDPNTQTRARKLAGLRRAIAEGRRMTPAEFSGE
uniref:Uncharacterized protein n=1 Tax=viral metagenome TaxID=1070528 RepID=A0A6M3JHD8_9ZZZZ